MYKGLNARGFLKVPKAGTQSLLLCYRFPLCLKTLTAHMAPYRFLLTLWLF